MNFGVNSGHSGYDLGIETEEPAAEARGMLMKLFGADAPDELFFSYNSNEALDLVV